MSDRREFLTSACLAAGASLLLPRSYAQTSPVPVTVKAGLDKLGVMPGDFTGLSYEIVQLYNPNFFSSSNTQLVKAFRDLSPRGVLRVGGNLSDLSRWKSDAGDFDSPRQAAAIEKGKTYWEWKLTDSTVRADRSGAITPTAIRSLRSFLDATNWRLIYGLNFGSGSPERAADEASCVAREIGDRLIAFQIGNESDFFGGNRLFRERPFDFEQYYAGYRQFTDAVRAQVPRAKFAGPDVANNFSWVEQFAAAQNTEVPDHRAVLLTGHYYAMGPASNPAMNAERLLAPNPRLTDQIAKVNHAKSISPGMGYRMTEGNSCFGGGKPGVSDSFCSALWVADYMLHLASAGYIGVNLHSGGDGFYTAIETLDAKVATPRPLFYGMQYAELFAGMEILSCDLTATVNMTAYLARDGKALQLALINKSPTPVSIVPSGLPTHRPHKSWALTAHDLTSTDGVRLAPVPPKSVLHSVIPSYSAVVHRWNG